MNYFILFQDYLNENTVIVLLREILPKLTEKVKNVCFICEWCEEKKKSLIGYASHVKKCAAEQNVTIFLLQFTILNLH